MKRQNRKKPSESPHFSDVVDVSFSLPRAEYEAITAALDAFMAGCHYEGKPTGIAARCKILLRRDHAKITRPPSPLNSPQNSPMRERLEEN